MEPFLRFDNVWKRFRRGELHDSLRDLVPALLRSLGGRRRSDDIEKDEFWALQGMSFEVRPGQALGIIGGNGAGKSTALKILTRILRPNRGTVESYGKVGAMIEIAAGFHPDLTGRENVFLQGSIRGIPAAEIRRRFDDIVDFAGIAEFIDTPVKRYSSGMNARLGFSVAAHLDPDVLVIDEVLSVGDFNFQARAFDRVRSLVTGGIPVVLVSHQLDRVATLCTEAILLDRGKVLFTGSPQEAIARYTQGEVDEAVSPNGAFPIRFESIEARGAPSVESGGILSLVARGVVNTPLDLTEVEPVFVRLRSGQTGGVVYRTNGTRLNFQRSWDPGSFTLDVGVQMNLHPGPYLVEVGSWDLTRDRPLGAVIRTQVFVDGTRNFIGTVQLNATLAEAAGR